MLNANFIAFTAIHVLSIASCLLTYLILSYNAPTPVPSSPVSSTTPTHASLYRKPSSNAQNSHLLLRLACFNAALYSFIIVSVGLAYSFQLDRAPIFLCWTEGILLNYLFLTQHTVTLAVCIQIWLILVLRVPKIENRLLCTLVTCCFMVPALIVASNVVVLLVMDNSQLEHNGIGVGQRPGYCFWSKPYWIRITGYTVWYFVFAIHGAVLAVWAAIHLILQRSRQQNLIASISSTQTSASDLRARKYRTPCILHRTTFFALIYTLIATLSYAPILIRIIFYASDDEPDGILQENSYDVGLSEYSSSFVGIAMLLIFGTGEKAAQFFRHFSSVLCSYFRPTSVISLAPLSGVALRHIV